MGLSPGNIDNGDHNNTNNTRYVASVVALYWFVSISMVYLNKVLMSSNGGKTYNISAPLFVTWFQCLVTAVICYIAGNLSQFMNSQRRIASEHLPLTTQQQQNSTKGHTSRSLFLTQFPKAKYDPTVGLKILPLSVIFVGMITLNNLCLNWVEVSFYNVARSLTIVFNVVLSSLVLRSSSSRRTLCCLTIVIFGFFMGTKGETNFSMEGTIAGVCSSLFVSLNSIFTKKVLPAVDNDHWKLTFYNNVNAVVLFLPLMAIFEYQIIMEAVHEQFASVSFWIAMIIAGVFGFSIGIVTVLQIKATSPLSHNISGTAKAAVQSMMAFVIWENPATFTGVLGMFVVLGGSLLYTMTKMKEATRRSRRSSSICHHHRNMTSSSGIVPKQNPHKNAKNNAIIVQSAPSSGDNIGAAANAGVGAEATSGATTSP